MSPVEVCRGVYLVRAGNHGPREFGELRAQFEGSARAMVAAGLVPPEWAERGSNRRRHSCGYALDWEGRRLSIRYSWRPSLTHDGMAERWLEVTYYGSAEELKRGVEYPFVVLVALARAETDADRRDALYGKIGRRVAREGLPSLQPVRPRPALRLIVDNTRTVKP